MPDRKNKIDKWAAPKYWAEVEYRDITTDGLLRHTTFRGLYASRAAKKPLVAKFRQESDKKEPPPGLRAAAELDQEEERAAMMPSAPNLLKCAKSHLGI